MAFDRAKERCAIAAAIAEDDEIFAVLDKAADVGPYDPLEFPVAGLDKDTLATMYGELAQKQLAPGAYLMNPKRFSDILKWDSDDLDQVSLNVILETGQYGVIFGTRLIMSTRLDPDKIYLVTTPDKLGRLPERKAVEIKIFDNIPLNQYDIVAWEQIGLGIHNTAGAIRATKGA